MGAQFEIGRIRAARGNLESQLAPRVVSIRVNASRQLLFPDRQTIPVRSMQHP
jgi:hypothetical protein